MFDIILKEGTCYSCKLEGDTFSDMTLMILIFEKRLDQFSTFFKRVNNIYNKHAPIKNLSTRKIKQFAKTWTTKMELITSIKVKNKLYVMGDSVKYTYYKNKITTVTRLSKQTYYANYFLVN